MEREHQNVTELRTTKISTLLGKYYWPAFTGAIIHTLYNIVDRIFIGQGVGAEALAGLTSVFPIMLILMAFGMLVGMGAGVRISLNLGKKNFNRAEHVLGNALMLCLTFAVVLTVGAFAVKTPLLELFGVSANTMGYANDYLDIILLGSVFNMTGFALNNIIRSEGNAKIAMYSMLISAGLNLILDPIFIFVLDMGVQGAALATVISQSVLFLWVIYHFLNKRSVIKLRWPNFKPNFEIIIYIITIGFAPFAMQLAASVVQGTSNAQLVRYGGDLAVGSMGVIMSVAMLFLMAVFALNMASQPIVSFNYGAKDYERVKQTLLLTLKLSTAIAISGGIIVELFPGAIARMFNRDNEEFIAITTRGLRLVMIMYPVVGFQIVVSNYFQAVSNAWKSALLSLLRQVLSLIPLLIILPRFWGLDGVWMAFPFADTISAIACALFLSFEIKRLNGLIAA
jgi:putative MATE family efflux protein